jgi:hypothetical protein
MTASGRSAGGLALVSCNRGASDLLARIYATPRPVVERVKKLLAP